MSNTQKIVFSILGISALGAIVWKAVDYFQNSKKPKAITPVDVSFPIVFEAMKYVGIKEIEDNQGWENAADFTAKMKAAGWQTGWAYCVGFVKMVLMQCCTGDARTFFEKNVSWNTLITWNNLTKEVNPYCKVVDAPDMGCLVCYEGHTEICTEVFNDGYINVVTANSQGVDSKGNKIQGVFVKKRKIAADLGSDKFLGFIKILKID